MIRVRNLSHLNYPLGGETVTFNQTDNWIKAIQPIVIASFSTKGDFRKSLTFDPMKKYYRVWVDGRMVGGSSILSSMVYLYNTYTRNKRI